MLNFGEVLIYFRSDFEHINSTLQCRLVKQYCWSFYGSPLWSFMSNGFRNICISWRKALRKIGKISNRTHCNLVDMLSDSDPLEQRLVHIFKKFSDQALMCGFKTSKVNYSNGMLESNFCVL